MLTVTSSFLSRAASKNAPWARKFLMGTSDYTSRVMSWPTVLRKWDDVVPSTVTIDLSNADKTFNFFLTDGTLLTTNCTLQMGFADELLSLMSGTIDAIRSKDEVISLTLINKFKKLSDRIIGDLTSPTLYTNSNYLVHDLAWYICTSHGNLSALTSTNNPDIDYASFNSWTAVFSADNVRMNARFTGNAATSMLKKIALLTQSAIWVENNKLKFVRFTAADSSSVTLNDSTTIDGTQTMDARALVNRCYVGANYNITSATYAITVSDANSSSISRYGAKERIFKEENIWYVDSASAINLAQRTVLTNREIEPRLTIESPLQAVHLTIGDTIAVIDSHVGLNANYRIMEESVNMDSGRKIYVADRSQYTPAFQLDFSSLDSLDILT